MMRSVLLTSALTGLFCALFAGVVDLISLTLDLWQVMLLGAVSGSCGSLIAQLVLGRQRG